MNRSCIIIDCLSSMLAALQRQAASLLQRLVAQRLPHPPLSLCSEINRIRGLLGTAVNVQSMVYGAQLGGWFVLLFGGVACCCCCLLLPVLHSAHACSPTHFLAAPQPPLPPSPRSL